MSNAYGGSSGPSYWSGDINLSPYEKLNTSLDVLLNNDKFIAGLEDSDVRFSD